MEIIIAVLTTFLGLFLYERAKRKSAEGALNNIEVKKLEIKKLLLNLIFQIHKIVYFQISGRNIHQMTH